jgi:hypothetical protein
MHSDGIRTVRRAGGEDAGQGIAQVVARVHRQHLAGRLVEPGENQQVLTGCDPVQAAQEVWLDLYSRVGRAFIALLGRISGPLQGGVYPADGSHCMALR